MTLASILGISARTKLVGEGSSTQFGSTLARTARYYRYNEEGVTFAHNVVVETFAYVVSTGRISGETEKKLCALSAYQTAKVIDAIAADISGNRTMDAAKAAIYARFVS